MRNFDLAPFSRVAPEVVVSREGRDRTEQFFLALALAYNDLKDVNWLLEETKDAAQRYAAGGEVTPQRAQVVGMSHHATRFILGITPEILTLVKEFGAEIEGEYVQGLAARLTARHREAWETVVAARPSSFAADERLPARRRTVHRGASGNRPVGPHETLRRGVLGLHVGRQNEEHVAGRSVPLVVVAADEVKRPALSVRLLFERYWRVVRVVSDSSEELLADVLLLELRDHDVDGHAEA